MTQLLAIHRAKYARPKALCGQVPSSDRMIQTTTRLSRGARLRRRPMPWLYLILVVVIVASALAGLMLRRTNEAKYQ